MVYAKCLFDVSQLLKNIINIYIEDHPKTANNGLRILRPFKHIACRRICCDNMLM